MRFLPARRGLKKAMQQQHGLTMISWVFVLAIVAFCGMFAFAVVPMYAENMYVEKALKSLAEPNNNLAEMSNAEINKRLQNFYMVNNVRSEGAQKIVIDRKSTDLLIRIDYENRINLFYNIDIVTSFQNHLDAGNPSQCCKPLVDKRAAVKH
jgi:Tfp pilus assembly protein PilE